MFSLPVVVLVNAVIVGWIGRRLFAYDTMLQFLTHGQALASHIPRGAIRLSIYGGVGLGVFAVVGTWLARRIAVTWVDSHRNPKPLWVTTVVLAGCIIGSLPLSLRPDDWLLQMRTEHTRHSWTVLGIIAAKPPVFLSADTAAWKDQQAGQLSAGQPERPPRGLAFEMRERIHQKDARLKQLHIQSTPVDSSQSSQAPDTGHDVLVVIIESMRRELVDSTTMPHLWSVAQKGIHCQNHFSGGNATTHGMFSLFNGIDSIWYSLSAGRAPLLTRLLGQAGYETGFFAGHDDWQAFKMDGFVNSNAFDAFHVTERDWLVSDRLAAQRAADFLKRTDPSRKPRLAVLYLYSTHADYRSYATDQIFQPAARDGYLIPYTANMRDRVWNRYKNSARSVDRLLGGMIRDDLILVVTGDHGESFLEDDVCGHGTKLNRFQNMTPAIVSVPGGSHRLITQPTTHADVLPTILDAARIRVNDLDVMDGYSLLQDLPDTRVLLTRNYLDHDVWLVTEPDHGWAQRFTIRTNEWTTRYVGPQRWSSDSNRPPVVAR